MGWEEKLQLPFCSYLRGPQLPKVSGRVLSETVAVIDVAWLLSSGRVYVPTYPLWSSELLLSMRVISSWGMKVLETSESSFKGFP